MSFVPRGPLLARRGLRLDGIALLAGVVVVFSASTRAGLAGAREPLVASENRRGPGPVARGAKSVVAGVGGVADRASERWAREADRLVSAGRSRRGKCVAVLSRLVAHFFGSEVLSRSSVCVWASAGYRPVKHFGLGGSLVFYSGRPSQDFADRKVYVSYGVIGPLTYLRSTGEGDILSLTLPVPGLGVNVGASASPVKHALSVAVPFGPSISAGDFRERGPFVGGAVSVLGPVSLGACLYYPPLQPIADVVKYPALFLYRIQMGVLAAGRGALDALKRAIRRAQPPRDG